MARPLFTIFHRCCLLHLEIRIVVYRLRLIVFHFFILREIYLNTFKLKIVHVYDDYSWDLLATEKLVFVGCIATNDDVSIWEWELKGLRVLQNLIEIAKLLDFKALNFILLDQVLLNCRVLAEHGQFTNVPLHLYKGNSSDIPGQVDSLKRDVVVFSIFFIKEVN